MFNFHLLKENFSNTLFRFPFVILIAIIGSITACLLIDARYDDDNRDFYTRVILSCIIILPLQISYHLLKEKTSFQGIYTYLLPIFLFPLIYWLMERVDTENGFFKFAAAFFTTHLFLSFSIYSNEDSKKDFWEINQIFLVRFSIAVLYSTVLYAGISIAILALDVLLGIKIYDRFFGYLFFWTFGFFNTIVFLSGLPKFDENFKTESWNQYPLVLKILVQYILLPLVTIYLLILYLYIFRILIDWNIPKGWVSYLVLCFSIAGILSLLLVEPLKENTEQKWIKAYYYYFYRALIPLLVLLFISIGMRIWDYGFTVPRYYVFLLALWLTFITFYFLFSPKQNIQIIPKSLFFAGLISFIPPLSANFVSEYSQMNRLTNILESVGALKNGKIQKIDWNNNIAKKNAASSIATYLLNNHSYSLFHSWLEDSVVQRLELSDNQKIDRSVTNDYLEALGLNYYGRYGSPITEPQRYYFYGNRSNFYEFDGKVLFLGNMNFNRNDQLILNNKNCKISRLKKDYYQIVYKQNFIDTFSFEPIKKFAFNKIKNSQVNYNASLEIDTTYFNLSSKTKIYLTNFDIEFLPSKDSLDFQYLQGDIILQLK